VFADADIESAVKWTSMGIFFNHGQCCCAGSRIYVHESIYDEFLVKFNETACKIKLGDQMVEGTEHGPIVDSIQFDRVMSFINQGKTEGAHCVVGGTRFGTSGYFKFNG
jgi:aldehyde dehydrogenase (NAD+)